MRRKKRNVILTVGVAFLLGLAFIFCRLGMLFENASEPVQDLSRYEEILVEYDGGSEVVAHFPSRIPETATKVKLYYMPRVLQGGSYLRLSYSLPSSELETIAEQYSQMAYHIENGRPSFDIPEDFEVYYLSDSSVPDWSGYVYGVAVSMQQQEIIYWVEDVQT